MFTLNCNGRLLVVDKPLVMGIINATPDSFYAASRQQATDSILTQAEQMILDGAAIIDIGGQSTRPGSDVIGAEEELARVIEPIAALRLRFPDLFISVDTYHARVATEAVAAGASLINDISAGTMDPDLLPAVAALQVPYILMHMQGTPQTMQQQPHYENVTREVLDFLVHKRTVLHEAGIHDIIIDPGFGFGKTIAHNFQLLRELEAFQIIDAPLLLGISRKSTIYKTLGITAEEALNGTTVLNTIGLLKGANILRVHDVRQAVEAVRLVGSLEVKVDSRSE
jgi:dihydropteroate synthase